MVKSKEDTITKFNEQVNMTVGELESWLASDKSHKAGTGVGLESGRKIIEILKKNPDKDPDEYEEVRPQQDTVFTHKPADIPITLARPGSHAQGGRVRHISPIMS
ncbi:hypothetical protein BV22DRAFT_1035065 [Leucogyrophana mollusca]|uniref:Uncharacterized protein n=1 Tax=Leucogyrophana mollusca TaxID=85980 RepID=A0ACB8BF66_9AGAM|nr:hypothetical protein BV22DRAFT_1035065 [Leucogyrophana mollusca]